MHCYKASMPVLKALCDETRLCILKLLSDGQRNGCEIHRAFCCSQPTISYHMKVLVDSGLVLSQKEGCAVIYSLNPSLWPSVQQCLDQLCAANPQQEATHE
ncbi:MAG: winged helix-turn-helix transcriptional regulator [Clostridia bacterium]|nr:winged helix-turn-helix transcriptional regulator [Clostridia bacterium]MBP3649481.1 winged helix-turn-helix transcriptional regulator [Clostridia bacterium]